MEQQQQQQIPILITSKTNDGIITQTRKHHNSGSRTRNYSDTESSCIPETTSESGISDLDMSEKCNCCPYGYHIDVDFVNFLETLDSKNLIKHLKKIQRKRNERIQRSMEYVIDEVEKIRQLNEVDDNDIDLSTDNLAITEFRPLTPPRKSDPSPNRSRPRIPNVLKETINRIDQEINTDFDPKAAKLFIEQRKRRSTCNTHSSSPPNTHTHNSQENIRIKHSRSNSNYHASRSPPRHKRSTSASSNRVVTTDVQQHEHRSRSGRRSKSHSKSPGTRKSINRLSREEMLFMDDTTEDRVETTTHTYVKSTPSYVSKTFIEIPSTILPVEPPTQEVTLNVVSLSNTNIIDSSKSSSSESLCSFPNDDKLKIKETYEPKRPVKQPVKPVKQPQPRNDDLVARIRELETKLSKLPELEIKNSALLEERILLLKQLSDYDRTPLTNTIKRDIGVECRSNTRDVGILHVATETENKENEKILEMTAVINSLREKLDEQTLTMQKPPTRDVAMMHVVDKIEEEEKKMVSRGTEHKVTMRDVAISHTTEDEQQKQEIREMLERQRETITNTFIKEMDVLKRENVHLSASLEEAIKKQSKSLVTRGTLAPEAPVLYSVGVNTKKNTTRDVQIMFTPKCRDVALGTDRFYYTRDVNLYCNLDSLDETYTGNEQISTLYEIKVNKKKFGPRSYRDVCLGVNMDPPKVTRDVNIGCNLDSFKQFREVSIGCNLDPKPEKRDVATRVNFDEIEKKQYRDVLIGVNILKPTQDAAIYVNTIEEVKIPEKPQQRHVSLDTSSLLSHKDTAVGPDHSTPDAPKTVKRDFSTTVNFDDPEKIKLLNELAQLKLSKVTRDVGISMDHISRLNANLVSNSFTTMDVPKYFSKHVNTDSVGKRESFTNTDKQVSNSSHKASGDFNVNDEQVSINELHLLKTQITKLESEKIKKKDVKTIGVGLCSVHDVTDVKPKPVTHTVAVGSEDYRTHTRTIGCGDCKIDGNFCDKCSYKNIRSTGVGTVTMTENRSCITDLYNLNEKIGIIKQQQTTTLKRPESFDETTTINEEIVYPVEKVKTVIKNYQTDTGSSSTVIQQKLQSASSSSINQDQQQQQQQHQSTITSASTSALSPRVPKVTETKKETEFEQRKLTRIDGGKKLFKETITISTANDQVGKTKETASWQHVVSTDDKGEKGVIIPVNKAVSASTETFSHEFPNADDKIKVISRMSESRHSSSQRTPSTSSVTSITIPITTSPVESPSESHISSHRLLTTVKPNDDYTSISTEEVTYKDGKIAGKRITENIQLKPPKSILKTGTATSMTTFSPSSTISKALKFGEVIKTSLQSESQESFSNDESSYEPTATLSASATYEQSEIVNEVDVPISIEKTIGNLQLKVEKENEFVEGEEGELAEYDDFQESQEKISSIADEDARESSDPNTGLKKQESTQQSVPSQRFELEVELHIACAILNDSLFDPLKADKTKVAKALHLIQQDWFKIAAHEDSNPHIVAEHLKAFYHNFSNLLLERIVNMADLNLNTVLHYSVTSGNFEIVNLLLDTNVCDVNAQNQLGYTSIMLAALVPVKEDYHRQTLRRLFAEGNVNIKSTQSGQTALMLAVRHANKETVQLLLEAGSDVNLQDKDGSTALMCACEHGHIDIVRLLLDNTNCDPDIKDNDGETAFDIAKTKNRNDIIVLLYAHSSKMRSHHPAMQFSKQRPRIGSAPTK